MGKIIRFFNYDAALEHYEEAIIHMRRWTRGHGRVKTIAKPVLILSIIKGMKDGEFTNNRFGYHDLKNIFEPIFKSFFLKGSQDSATPLYNPYYYLQTDGFWHLSWKDGCRSTLAPSENWLERNVNYGFIDEELWILINNEEYAERLKDYIIRNLIIQTFEENGNDMAAEDNSGINVKSLLTLLLAI